MIAILIYCSCKFLGLVCGKPDGVNSNPVHVHVYSHITDIGGCESRGSKLHRVRTTEEGPAELSVT